MNYVFHLLIMICIYVVLVQSLNLAAGYGGLLSLCHAAFYGIGAYVAAMLMINLRWSFASSLVVAVFGTSLIAWLVSFPATRLRGNFFFLATLGFQMIVYAILYNWVDVTQGAQGIAGIPRPSLFGFRLSTVPSFALFALITAIVCCGIIWWLTAAPYGRTLQAVREDEIAAASLGKDVNAFKRSAFTWGGGMAAVAGVLFATYSSYIDPTSFRLEESIFILFILVIGGAGNMRGPFIGAIVLVLLPEVLRFLSVPDSIAANLRQLLYGLAIIVLMRLRPQGIAGKYAFD